MAVAIEVVSDPAKILAILFPTRIVERSSDGFKIIKAIAFPFAPPSSINWRARSAPIESSAASAAEKNVVAKKHKMREITSKEMLEKLNKGGSIGMVLVG
jgi:hypothetical protein